MTQGQCEGIFFQEQFGIWPLPVPTYSEKRNEKKKERTGRVEEKKTTNGFKEFK